MTAAVAALIVSGVTIFCVSTRRQDVAPPVAAEFPLQPSRQSEQSGPPRFADVSGRTATCPELNDLRAELTLREREAMTYGRFESAFALSPFNPIAQKNIGAVLDQAFARSGRCGHSVECRGLVCRVETLVPEGVAHHQACTSFSPEARWGERR